MLLLKLLAIGMLGVSDEPKIITCTVVEPRVSVECPEKVAGLESIPSELLDEWELVAPMQGELPNTDAPLGRLPTQKGDRVKLKVIDGKVAPIPTCEVRVWRRVKEWRKYKEGERVPMTLYTPPDDCQPERIK